MKPEIAIHVCCAICGAYLSEVLGVKFRPVLYFYNPNIHPREEYEKRKASVEKLADIKNIEFIEGPYDADKWFENIKGYEDEPEGGARCPLCFKMRLLKTARLAKEKNAEYFTSTLSASPYKNENLINALGKEIGKEYGIVFLTIEEIGEKRDIWAKSRSLAKENDFYHQKYCGCIFSQKKTE